MFEIIYILIGLGVAVRYYQLSEWNVVGWLAHLFLWPTILGFNIYQNMFDHYYPKK